MKSLETGEWDFPSEVKVYFLLQSMWIVNSSVFPFFIILCYASYPFVVKLWSFLFQYRYLTLP